MRVRSVAVGLFAVVALGCNGSDDDTSTTGCSESDLDACEYDSPGLEFTERTAQATDETTGRVLPLRIRIPDGDGPFPVVIYSHGGAFDDNGHLFGSSWGETFASHGYVAINIGNSSPTLPQAEYFCTVGAVPEGECDETLMGEDSGMIALIKAYDLATVISELPVLAAAGAELGGPEVDIDEVAAIGWSGGSRAGIAGSGAGFRPSPSAPVFSDVDPRIATRVGLSPAGAGFGGFFADESATSWDTFLGPALIATGDNDVKPNSPDLTGPIRRDAYEYSPADGTRRLLYSNLPEGEGGHSTYNLEDLESTDEEVARFSRALRSVVLAFFDDTLVGDADAHAWLETDDAHVLAGDADWESK